MPCPCEACSAAPEATWTEAHRMQCEARHVASMAHLSDRQGYLKRIGVKRGASAKAVLAQAVIKAWLEKRVSKVQQEG